MVNYFDRSYYATSFHVSRIMDVIMQDDPGTSRAPSKKSSEYKLPPVPLDITQAMQKHTKGHYVGCRSRLIQWLYHDLCLYDM